LLVSGKSTSCLACAASDHDVPTFAARAIGIDTVMQEYSSGCCPSRRRTARATALEAVCREDPRLVRLRDWVVRRPRRRVL